MFQVKIMRGYSEPWWFFEDWQEDVINSQSYQRLATAKITFNQLKEEYKVQFDHMKAKNNYCIAFWNDNDIEFCEECDDDVQIFTGILIVDQNNQLVIEKEVGEKSVKES